MKRGVQLIVADFGLSALTFGSFRRGVSGKLILQQLRTEPFPSGWNNENPDNAAISRIVRTASRGFSGTREVTISIPAPMALTKRIRVPSLAVEKRGAIMEFEAAENIPLPLEEVVWDFQVLGDDGVETDAVLAAVKKSSIQAICDVLDAARLPAGRAIPAGIGLYHAFRYNYPEVSESVAVVDLGDTSAQILFVSGNTYQIRSLPCGGRSLTEAVARELGVATAAAAASIPSIAISKDNALRRAVSAFVAQIRPEIVRAMVGHRQTSGGPAPAAIYLACEERVSTELIALLSESLGTPVKRYDPLRKVTLPEKARAEGMDTSIPAVATLVGLAAVANAPASGPNLLPLERVAALRFRQRRPVIMAAAAMIGLSLVPPMVYYHQRVEEAAGQLKQLEADLQPMRLLRGRIEQTRARIEVVQKQITALQGAFEARSSWVHFLMDLQVALAQVEDVWLDELHVERAAAGLASNASVNSGAAKVSSDDRVVRVVLSGRLLDVQNPQSKVSPESLQRVKNLLASFVESPFVAAIEKERFDIDHDGLLGFDVTLIMQSGRVL